MNARIRTILNAVLAGSASEAQLVDLFANGGIKPTHLASRTVLPVIEKAASGQNLTLPELGVLTSSGVNIEKFLGIKPKAEAPTAPAAAPVQTLAEVLVPTGQTTESGNRILQAVKVEDPFAGLPVDEKVKASLRARARTSTIYTFRDALKANGVTIEAAQHTKASGLMRFGSSLKSSVLNRLEKSGVAVRQDDVVGEAIDSYVSALRAQGIVVADTLVAPAKANAAKAYHAFIAEIRSIVAQATTPASV